LASKVIDTPPTAVILQVALPVPLRRCFDYLPAAHVPLPIPGARLRVPFGNRERIGVLHALATTSMLPVERLRRVSTVLDNEALWPPSLLRLLHWSSRYYHHPIGEVMLAALPAFLRRGHATGLELPRVWRLRRSDWQQDARLRHSPRRQRLLQRLTASVRGLEETALAAGEAPGWRRALRALQEGGWVEAVTGTEPALPTVAPASPGLRLNPEQRVAVNAILAQLHGHRVWLLQGVTGSGKTEVYLRAVAETVRAGRQALVLLPEIGLTAQTVERFHRHLGIVPTVVHSARGDRELLQAWTRARAGLAQVVLGTRSAVWTPLQRPGLIVVDEEHDRSYKQQQGFLYSARDVAAMRAKLEGIPLLLGSATPSLESLHNVARGRYRHLHLGGRAGGRAMPTMHVLDMRRRRMQGALSVPLAEAIGEELARGKQALIFLNRRGYAPLLLCHACGWQAQCRQCDQPLTLHRGEARLQCHRCGSRRRRPQACPQCGQHELLELGYGTQRIEQALARSFPTARIVRIDRDRVRHRGQMESLLQEVHTGKADILVGTQMISKGHHFERVTLVGVVDADRGLYSHDFRSSEHVAQQIIQVSGRAGRDRWPGRVLLQTHYPDHPLLLSLAREGYAGISRLLMQERHQAGLPPYARMALLRAEAVREAHCMDFLRRARQLLERGGGSELKLFGPFPAPLKRRAGRYRAQLVMQAGDAAELSAQLTPWSTQVEALAQRRRLRWSLDVDPVETL